MLVGHHAMIRYGMASAVIGSPRVWHEERRVRDEMLELLAFIGLADYADMPAGELSGGQRRLLALGRAMAAKPKLLMLDEPSLGLAPQIVARIFDIILRINQSGVPILLVEQNARQALKIAHRGYVIVTGRNQLTGTGAQLLASDEVRQAYLGE